MIPHDQDHHIDSTWEVFHIDENFAVTSEGYEVNAWFQDDWKPLSAVEVTIGIELLSMSRADLLSTVDDLGQDSLNFKPPGEKWSIGGILKYVASADWWYLDRLGMAFPGDQFHLNLANGLKWYEPRWLKFFPAWLSRNWSSESRENSGAHASSYGARCGTKEITLSISGIC
jgi:hypothetical protein